MSPKSLGILLLRVASLSYLFQSVLGLAYVPAEVGTYLRHQGTLNVSTAALMVLSGRTTSILFHLGFALILYFYARPLARFLTRDLEPTLEIGAPRLSGE